MHHHPLFARLYSALAPGMDAAGAAQHRDELVRGLAGRVVEVGCGPGGNFGHYPPAVEEVVAIEPEPVMRRHANAAAAAAAVGVHVVGGVAEALPVADASADAVVFSLVLCSVDDVRRAVAEAHRVLRPGGTVRLYEHVRSLRPQVARAQRVADTVWPLLAGGCHTSREPVVALRESGFAVERERRFDFPPGRLARLVREHVIVGGTRP